MSQATSDEETASPPLTSEDGRRAKIVWADAHSNPVELPAELGLPTGRPVLVVGGGAKTLTGDAYALAARVAGPAIGRAARLARAYVVDGGTASGIMAITGEAVRAHGEEDAVVVGVAPAGCVTHPGRGDDERAELDPNHSHFVLADSDEWGGETTLLLALSDALAAGAPIAMLVAGGGKGAQEEALQAVGRGWPVFVVVGTGGTADAVSAAWLRMHERRPTWLASALPKRVARALPQRWQWREPLGEEPADPALRKIVRDGDVRVYGQRDPEQLARKLVWELQDVEVLKLAWRSFATYDSLAGSARRSFGRFQTWILAGGIVATFIALLQTELDISPTSSVSWIDDVFHWSVVALPILVAVLIGMAYRLAPGKRWVLLRAAAETIKREIYRFRTRTGIYGGAGAQADGVSPQELLSAQLDTIETKLLQTEASSAELTPYSGPLPPDMYGASRDDDGLSPLDPERYLALRVGDQLSYFHPKVAALARTRRTAQFVVLATGAAGAVLAAAGFEIWIGLTTAIAGAAFAYLGYLQVESTMVAYNQSAGKLEALRRAWYARPPARRDQAGFDALVADAESVLATEHGGWVQQMNDALEELQAKQLEQERQAGIEQTTDSPSDTAQSSDGDAQKGTETPQRPPES
jgi:hypothetical protein